MFLFFVSYKPRCLKKSPSFRDPVKKEDNRCGVNVGVEICSSLFICIVDWNCWKVFFLYKRERESAHGQWETGAPSEKTGAGDYFKLIVKILAIKSRFFSWRRITSCLDCWTWLSRLGLKPLIRGFYFRRPVFLQGGRGEGYLNYPVLLLIWTLTV